MLPIRIILHPTDFSSGSESAFQLACSLARDAGARLIVLHVLEVPVIVYSGVAMAAPPPLPTEEERQAARERLHSLRPPDPAVAVDYRLEEGDPVTGIIAVAQEVTCDLIALGTHGKTGLLRLLMGSVAESVVRGAPCSVLTVKTAPPKS